MTAQDGQFESNPSMWQYGSNGACSFWIPNPTGKTLAVYFDRFYTHDDPDWVTVSLL